MSPEPGVSDSSDAPASVAGYDERHFGCFFQGAIEYFGLLPSNQTGCFFPAALNPPARHLSSPADDFSVCTGRGASTVQAIEEIRCQRILTAFLLRFCEQRMPQPCCG